MRIARAAFPLAIPFLVACSVSAGGEPASLDEGQSALEGGECPLLGEEAIEHTCIHAGAGPFVTVTAGANPATTTTDVSAEHTAYTVNLVSSGAGFGGRSSTRPTGTAISRSSWTPPSTCRSWIPRARRSPSRRT
ncbi:uncharacterized protein SOCE26_004270 [Sorangium cellulosum]|uniref:Secreted protein n=1 Tax=Sorangium cellulosum TaxID=56 RepID=A0A2L0EIC3_SORCE|nr:uncharacterized protein SOCE26_004270 [Sorangium cellulosum]